MDPDGLRLNQKRSITAIMGWGATVFKSKGKLGGWHLSFGMDQEDVIHLQEEFSIHRGERDIGGFAE
ncbi:MAG TPA: hypothetical protein VK968_19570 [Roseimicrobium sp.]|nr:hypothetical protein [Roseimicrobium sp.]